MRAINVDDISFSNFELPCGSSSFGRAIAFQAIGGEFEPRLPLLTACDGSERQPL